METVTVSLVCCLRTYFLWLWFYYSIHVRCENTRITYFTPAAAVTLHEKRGKGTSSGFLFHFVHVSNIVMKYSAILVGSIELHERPAC